MFEQRQQTARLSEQADYERARRQAETREIEARTAAAAEAHLAHQDAMKRTTNIGAEAAVIEGLEGAAEIEVMKLALEVSALEAAEETAVEEAETAAALWAVELATVEEEQSESVEDEGGRTIEQARLASDAETAVDQLTAAVEEVEEVKS